MHLPSQRLPVARECETECIQGVFYVTTREVVVVDPPAVTALPPTRPIRTRIVLSASRRVGLRCMQHALRDRTTTPSQLRQPLALQLATEAEHGRACPLSSQPRLCA